MKGKLTTTKIDRDLHEVVKIYCAEAKENIQDFYYGVAKDALPHQYVRMLEKKKKAK